MRSNTLLLGLLTGAASAIPFQQQQQQQQPLGTDSGREIESEIPAAQPLTQASAPTVHGRFLHITGMLRSDLRWSCDPSMLTTV